LFTTNPKSLFRSTCFSLGEWLNRNSNVIKTPIMKMCHHPAVKVVRNMRNCID
jgi:hypothetical protein